MGGVPANAKITFGPVQPGSKDYHGGGGNCLRVYTTGNNQLAVFVGVTEFRDLSLTVKTKRVVEKQKHKTDAGPQGVFVQSESEAISVWEDESA